MRLACECEAEKTKLTEEVSKLKAEMTKRIPEASYSHASISVQRNRWSVPFYGYFNCTRHYGCSGQHPF